MEIKGVKSNLKVEYPNINEISKKTLKKAIPSKWIKIGLTAFVLNVIAKQNVFAISDLIIDPAPLAGSIEVKPPIYVEPIYVEIINKAFPIVGGVSLIVFLISLIMIIKAKRKMKKENKNEKIKKRYKVIFIISIVLLLASIIAKILVECCL